MKISKAISRGSRFVRRDWQQPVGRLRRKAARFDSVIAVTGSAGKSCTTRLIGLLAGSLAPAHVVFDANTYPSVLRRMATSNIGARYWVQEVSGHSASDLRMSADFLRPDVAVVTNIQFDHISIHRDLDATAESKGQLVEALGENGVAILNADDPRVLAMAGKCRGRVVTYGVSQDADIRAVQHRDGLPGRMAFTATDGTDRISVETKFVDARWIPNFLAALACGTVLGIPFRRCGEILAGAEPELYKDSVHERNGVMVVLDTQKSPFWTIAGSLEIVRKANYGRKIFIQGTISDYRGSAGPKYRNTARQALENADMAIFCGPLSERVRKLQPEFGERLQAFPTYAELHAYLRTFLEPGDFVYAKASATDHLERVLFGLDEADICVRDRCGKVRSCDRCRHLAKRRFPSFGRPPGVRTDQS